jgi:hypothetical protein
MTALDLNLPPLEARLTLKPEIRPEKVRAWLAQLTPEPPTETARIVGDALAVLNRTRLADTVRLELTEIYYETAEKLWPLIRFQFQGYVHPLDQAGAQAVRNSTQLQIEIANGYKRLLVEHAEKRISVEGRRFRLGLIHRCQQSLAKVLLVSFCSYCPVPAHTWRDLHQVYLYARRMGLAQTPINPANEALTPETSYIQALLLSLANPYGLAPGKLAQALKFIAEHGRLSELSERMPADLHASAIASMDVGSDAAPMLGPPAAKDAPALYLDNHRLLIEVNRQLRELARPLADKQAEAARLQCLDFLAGLKRQWRIGGQPDLPRLARMSRVVAIAGLPQVWDSAHGSVPATDEEETEVQASLCDVVSHAPNNGYVLRQVRAVPAPLQLGEVVSMRSIVGGEWFVGVVRWFRNTLNQQTLEFGCEVLGREPEAVAVVVTSSNGIAGRPRPALVLAAEPELELTETLVAPPQLFSLHQPVTLQRRGRRSPIKAYALREESGVFAWYDFAPA